MKSIHVFAMLLVPVVLLVTGCSVPVFAPQIDIPPSVEQDSQIAALSVQDCHIRADLEFTNSLLHDKQVIEFWYARPDRIRLEVLESTQPGFQDVTAASMGTGGWTYQRSDNSVSIGPTDSVKPAIVYDLVRSALDVWFGRRDVQTNVVSTDYVSREWVFKLSDSMEGVERTLWLNTGSLLPVKLQYRSEELGRYTLTVTEAEYDLGLTEELFDLTLLPTDDYTVRSFE